MIGPDTADKLFGRTDGVTGETIRIDGQPFRVIGVLKSKGGSGFGNQDDRVLVPLTTAQSRLIQRSVARPRSMSSRPRRSDSDSVAAGDRGDLADPAHPPPHRSWRG